MACATCAPGVEATTTDCRRSGKTSLSRSQAVLHEPLRASDRPMKADTLKRILRTVRE
jgi:hypothetical protein